MKQFTVTHRLRTLLRATCHLATVAAALALATACQEDSLTDPQGNTLNPDGTVTITRLQVGIGENADAAAFDPSRPGIDQGYTTGVKTSFVEGDVLHLVVYLTKADFDKGTPQLSTATLSGGSWTLKPAIRLPQNAADAYDIQIIYDGKSTMYDSYVLGSRDDASDSVVAPGGFYAPGNFRKAYMEMSCPVNTGVTPWPDNNPNLSPAKTDANGNAYFHDALWCEGGAGVSGDSNYGTLSIGAGGTLGITMAHVGSLLRITSIDNQLGSPVTRAELITATDGEAGTYQTVFTLWGEGEVTGNPTTPGVTPGPDTDHPWQAVIGIGFTHRYYPKFIRITLANGRTCSAPLPNTDGSPIDPANPAAGLYIVSNEVYAYRLSLLPGSLTAVPVTTEAGLAWTTKPDPAVPIGYTAIRTRADLEAIAASVANMKGNYILMNDIDLTPATPTAELWTPLGCVVPAAATPDDIDEGYVPFTGRFNGNGHTLHGLTIQSDRQRLGLFALLYGATIYNLHFSKANIACTQRADESFRGIGTLTGYAYESTISLCSTTACTVKYSGEATVGSQYPIAIGSLVGTSYHATFTQCHATRCTVTDATNNPTADAKANYAGGLAGQNGSGSRLVSCYTRSCTVTSTANTYAGGLTGLNDKNSLTYGCYVAVPTVSGGKANGALVGLNPGNSSGTDPRSISLIASCYATLAPGSTATRLVGFNGYPFSSSSTDPNATGTANPAGLSKIIACISPLTDRSKEQPTDNLANVVSITARGTARGYLPLKDATELAALAANADFATTFGFTADGTGISAVNTATVNTSGSTLTEGSTSTPIPPGGIYVKARPYTAAGIWSDLQEATKVIPPLIEW